MSKKTEKHEDINREVAKNSESRSVIDPKDIKPGVSLKTVYSHGELATRPSFGGMTLSENMERVDKALNKSFELNKIYNRNHSEWTRRHINLDHYDPWFNLRQVSAELSSRRGALTEAKWRHVENEIKAERLRRDLHNKDDELDRLEDLAEIAKLEEGLETGLAYIEGAMKEVLILEDLYEQVKDQLDEEFSEADYEQHNARAHLRQAISQSLRDVRAVGHITKGEQELLEQIGVNPTHMQGILQKYVEADKGRDEISVLPLKHFIETLADDIIQTGAIEKKSEAFGFSSKPRQDFMFIDKVGQRDEEVRKLQHKNRDEE